MKKIALAAVFMSVFFTDLFALSEQGIIDKFYNYLAGIKTPPNGEINLRLGIDTLSGVYYYAGSGKRWEDYSSVANVGFSFGAEYIIPVNGFLKAGAGAQYALPRQADGQQSFDGHISFIPVYAIAQFQPIWFLPNIFVKLNAGYAFSYLKDSGDLINLHAKTGGFMWDVSTGIYMTKNLIAEVSYNKFYSAVEMEWPDGEFGVKNMSFSKICVSIIYRIKL
jgi:hypothetical protein